jgi:primase-polymerase (primpol)-like protein
MPRTLMLGQRRPSSDSSNIAHVPDKLKAYDQWVVWRYGKKRADGNHEKMPVGPTTLKRASVGSSETWATFQQALTAIEGQDYVGIGFVFCEEDDFCGIDFDDCGDRETGWVHPEVLEEIRKLGNPYTEWSPSGKGLKSFLIGQKSANRCVTKETPWGGKLEVYDGDRFFYGDR